MPGESQGFLERRRLQDLFDLLAQEGYETVGPRVRDGAILYEPIASSDDLPRGWRDLQSPGSYRLETGESSRLFAWANGPQALKPFLFAPRELLWETRRSPNGDLSFSQTFPKNRRLAVIGVRACDLAALDLSDRHFGKGPFPDPAYASRRRDIFLVAVDCSHPASTCFCVSTGDGPDARSGYDLALGELDEGFLIREGSDRGREILRRLSLSPPDSSMTQRAARQSEQAATSQIRHLPAGDFHHSLLSRPEHPHWNSIAARCLACGNCTSVCPTCFCFSEKEEPALDGLSSQHVREWDSCFTAGHSFIHPAPLRGETRFRYRQWLSHKLGSWHEQYGRSGCVGCGRCLTWCPVGIDFTEDLPKLLEDPHGD